MALQAVATALLLVTAPVLATAPALGQTPAAATTAPAAAVTTPAVPKCTVPVDQVRFDLPLARTALRLSGGLPIKIVAIGSSSTFGAGASSRTASYPSRLAGELTRHFPGHALTVLNRGVNGDEAKDMIARFETGVIAENPHLVLWQVGTNSLLSDRPLDSRAVVLHEGLARLKAIRADIVLIDPQFAPRVIAKASAEATVSLLARIAKEEKVDLYRRYASMRRWHETDGMPFESFVSTDGLHMNDWSYACLAKGLGVAIAEAATRPTATATGPRSAR